MPNQFNNKGRSTQVIFTCTPEEKAELRRLAWDERVTVGDWIRARLELAATVRAEAKRIAPDGRRSGRKAA